MINLLHEAVTRWGVSQMKRLTTEYFNQAEFRTLWDRISQFADVESQLRGRLEAREFGMVLPQGCERTYFRWIRSLSDPTAHTRAMTLLQRTREISKEDWKTLKSVACEQFGEKHVWNFLDDMMMISQNPVPKRHQCLQG
jgi:hypothetical protein